MKKKYYFYQPKFCLKIKVKIMNKLLKKLSFALVAIVLVSFSSCGDKPERDGYFVVGGKTYNIENVKLKSTGYADSYYHLVLTMEGTSYGELATLSFTLYSDINGYLSSGIYTPYLNDMHYAHKFKRGEWTLGEETTRIFIGKVKVTNEKEVYKISIDSEDEKGLGVAAEFSGELEVII